MGKKRGRVGKRKRERVWKKKKNNVGEKGRRIGKRKEKNNREKKEREFGKKTKRDFGKMRIWENNWENGEEDIYIYKEILLYSCGFRVKLYFKTTLHQGEENNLSLLCFFKA